MTGIPSTMRSRKSTSTVLFLPAMHLNSGTRSSVDLECRREIKLQRSAYSRSRSRRRADANPPSPVPEFIASGTGSHPQHTVLQIKLHSVSNAKVEEHSARDKFLIFSRQPLNLVHIAEGLDLLGIKYLDYRSRLTKKEQALNALNLMTFETSDTFRVFLMEFSYRNIISASRIIFCEPVWRSSDKASPSYWPNKARYRYGSFRLVKRNAN